MLDYLLYASWARSSEPSITPSIRLRNRFEIDDIAILSLAMPLPSHDCCFNVADKITNKFYLICFVRNIHVCEFLFKQDRQFNNIDQVEPEIISEVRGSADRFDIEPEMLGNKSADLACKRSFFQAGHR